MEVRRRIPTFQTFLKVWVVVFTAAVIWLVVDDRHQAAEANKRAKENTQLILQVKATQKAIQASRLESCKQNYTSQLEAFAPFRPKKDDPTTSRDEVQDFKSFTDNIKNKRAHCAEQVRPKKVERK